MCCRYYMEMSPALRPIVEAAKRSKLLEDNIARIAKPLTTRGEVAPGSLVPVIATGKTGGRKVFPMLWGFQTDGLNKPVYNARLETAPEKKTFRESWETHRCIVPASWYFEWEYLIRYDGMKVPGQKYAIMPKGQELTWLCGLYRIEDQYPHFVILTRPSGEEIAFIHDRMPLIMPREEINNWCDPEKNPALLADKALTDVVFEAWTAEDELRAKRHEQPPWSANDHAGDTGRTFRRDGASVK